MSIRSTPYPLHSNVKKNVSIPITHQTHQSNKALKKNELDLSAAMSQDLMSVNYLDDRKLCSLEPSSFGQISGCSVHHRDIFQNPQPDFVEKISDTSFSSQLFKSHYGTINQDAIRMKKEDIKKSRDKLPYIMVPGLELKKGLQLNRIDGLPNDLDAKDLYESYCHKKYKNKLFPRN
jgi:hypothetical protein